jgi:hypothetical protein
MTRPESAEGKIITSLLDNDITQPSKYSPTSTPTTQRV